MKTESKAVRILFFIRMILWIIALAATVYWIYWSFKLYALGYYDVYEYSGYLRPILGRGLLISFGSLGVSLILRGISDRIKKRRDRQAHQDETSAVEQR